MAKEQPTKSQPTKSLDGRYYTDPDIFAQEQQNLFARTWQFACHSSAVQNIGDYVSFTIGTEDMFCIRDKDGILRVFYNVCQHRAHQLVQGAGNTRALVCPYHAWTYELSGQLRSGPNVQKVAGFVRGDICLMSAQVEEFLGFIFVNLDENAAPMEDWYPNTRAELQEFVPNYRDLSPLVRVEIPEKCNWKVSVENYSECYHCALNHPTFSTGVVKPETYNIMPQGYCLRHTTECQNLDNMTYDINSGFAHAREYSSWYLWPNFSFQVYPGNVLNTYHWHAVAVDKVVIWRGWYRFDGCDEQMIHDLAVQDRATTVAEDIGLVESVQRGLGSRGYRPGPLVVDPDCGVNSEHSVKALHEWMRAVND